MKIYYDYAYSCIICILYACNPGGVLRFGGILRISLLWVRAILSGGPGIAGSRSTGDGLWPDLGASPKCVYI